MAKSSSIPAKSLANRSLVKKPAASKTAAKVAVPAKPAAVSPAKSPAKKAVSIKFPAKSIVKATVKPAAKPTPKTTKPTAKPDKPVAKAIARQSEKKLAKPVSTPAKPAPAKKAPKSNQHSFSKEDLEKFRKDMLAMRDMLHAKASDMRTNALTRHDEINPEEDGTDIIERLKDLQLVNGTEQLIHQIDAALLSISDGTYGICEICHELIGKGRLQALPFAKTCIDCQSKLEQNRPMRSSAHWSDL